MSAATQTTPGVPKHPIFPLAKKSDNPNTKILVEFPSSEYKSVIAAINSYNNIWRKARLKRARERGETFPQDAILIHEPVVRSDLSYVCRCSTLCIKIKT